ncbi:MULTISPECIES: hypothetical protein [unclassified Mesorhizobium]|jgi:hypothetical protein|uniref:hypothetical protein n=1 Tax=unclassified Mesorhizobium TaxID=325217 RepID=UPI000FCB382F|nr:MULTISPECIES: hypothetical protein [unclassified Mesorhizobium]RUU89885.1 hypothetical protein EOD03_02445 [Mesorhizobium sp. M7A.T.Ca.TU.009.01.1.2]RUV50638.1 hypothetical protein EOB77_14280 [Mesorhizobium sp. M7A.F.Ca.MR.228.00.0.0]RUT89526.1 hypothetical protein EOD14_02245 [Mesorhizobium sp. M7A.T.Ca.US.000.02.1.1]RUU04367.1 hypothetical protein EOD12_07175 [Mesorhizobium sp. M7A.T.Ca.TU.009.02.1.1]RUU82277.1 hypothetical protein EOC06_04970 [Mesorhizobium sp. M7A.F.Ca.MR.362.00.0.0]
MKKIPELQTALPASIVVSAVANARCLFQLDDKRIPGRNFRREQSDGVTAAQPDFTAMIISA